LLDSNTSSPGPHSQYLQDPWRLDRPPAIKLSGNESTCKNEATRLLQFLGFMWSHFEEVRPCLSLACYRDHFQGGFLRFMRFLADRQVGPQKNCVDKCGQKWDQTACKINSAFAFIFVFSHTFSSIDSKYLYLYSSNTRSYPRACISAFLSASMCRCIPNYSISYFLLLTLHSHSSCSSQGPTTPATA
jgi:hypothetical protein